MLDGASIGYLLLRVNDHTVAEVFDNDPKQQDFSGILALQLHTGPPMKVQFKDIRLKALAEQKVEFAFGSIFGKPMKGLNR